MTDKPKLAKKQRRVLDLLEKGKSPGQVAKTLKISVNGVYGHMRRIEAKGYEVPRSKGATKAAPKPKAKKVAASNGAIKAIDSDIEQIGKAITRRRSEILRENAGIAKNVERLRKEAEGLEDQVNALMAESDALGKREAVLAAASA